MKKNLLTLYKNWGELAKPYFEWQLKQFSSYLGKRIGDVGCGEGNFACFLKNSELYLGFEPENDLAALFRKNYQAENIRLATHPDITTKQAVEEMRENRLDTVICINVLEHIRNDKLALDHLMEGILPGGHICLLVPALPALYGTLDEVAMHYRRYSKKQLLDLAKVVGGGRVDIIECYFMNFIGALGWFYKRIILKEKAHGDENFKIMNLILPFVSFMEHFIKPPIGMSLVLVLKKL